MKQNTLAIIVSLQNLKSLHINSIRKVFLNIKSLIGKATLLVYKKSKLKTVYKKYTDCTHFHKSFTDNLKENIGIIFSNLKILPLLKVLRYYYYPSYAKSGITSQKEIWVRKGNTSVDPSYTSLFQVNFNFKAARNFY